MSFVGDGNVKCCEISYILLDMVWCIFIFFCIDFLICCEGLDRFMFIDDYDLSGFMYDIGKMIIFLWCIE